MRLALLAALCCACAQRAQIHSDPVGAEVYLDGERIGVAPVEVRIPYRPFFMEAPTLTLKLKPQYRSLNMELRRESQGHRILWRSLRHPGVALGLGPAPIYTVQLVPRHGPIGTWGIAGD